MTTPLATQALHLLKDRFQLAEFRRGQREIIESVLAGNDTLAVMPTGGGKSLCYQLPALARPGVTVVVSPLIALMRDQTAQLRRLGIAAGALHSGQTLEEKKEVFADMAKASHFLLYLSPERVQKDGFGKWLASSPVSLFAIDESHCVSQWGPDFRPDYYKLSALRQMRPNVPILALTATATPLVLNDVARQLGLKKPDRHVYGFYRENLYYQVEPCDDPAAKLRVTREAILRAGGRAILYCGTRQQCEEVTEALRRAIPAIGYYHAGLSAEERNRVQTDFESGKIKCLAATNAFGMGIDIPDIRVVVHFQLPANIESYYQEAGRAGRDGRESTCLLLYSKRDKGLQSYFIRTSGADGPTVDRRWRALEAITQFAEGGECRHAGILTYFKDSQRLKACGHCDICAPDSERRVPADLAPPSLAKPSRKAKTKKRSTEEGPLEGDALIRYEVLNSWRRDYADRNDIPAFLVFSNKSLRDLALRAPESLEELGEVYGFGDKKVEHLGPEILQQLARCMEGA